MSSQEPWAKNWKCERDVGKGGQGLTVLVSAQTDPARLAVLKKLKHNESEKARRRMFQEVAALRTLFAAKVKVSQVLEDNTDQFEQFSVPLYFVMDYIAPGTTLKKLVCDQKKQPLEKAVSLTLDLCKTVASAHSEKIFHRDIKPDNIIVRDFDNNDLVMVDFGLSFNQEEGPDESISDTREKIGNQFMPLPEAQLRGGDRRDHRTDLTYLSGILYYCLTGHYPNPFRDGRNRPPHRSEGFSIREALPDDPRVVRLERFFDMAFEADMGSRFQTIEALVSRLHGLLPPNPSAVEEPAAVEAEIVDNLLRSSRKAQLLRLGEYAKKVKQTLQIQLPKCIDGLTQFIISQGSSRREAGPVLSSGRDKTIDGYQIHVRLRGYDQQKYVLITFAAEGLQCGLLRTIGSPKGNEIPFPTWQDELWYAPEQPPSEAELLAFLKRALVQAMRGLDEDLARHP